MINERWKLQIVIVDNSEVEYHDDYIYRLQHTIKDLEIYFTKEQLLRLIKDEEFFSKIYGNVLSDRDIILGKNLINRTIK